MFNVLIQSLLVATIVFNFILGFIMALRRKKEENIIFALINFSVGLWALAILLYWFAALSDLALFFSKCAYTFAALVPIFFLRFVFIYPYRMKAIDKYPAINLSFLMIFVVWGLVWSNRIVASVERLNWGYNLVPASGYGFYILYFSFYMIVSFTVLYYKLRRSKGLRKLQLMYVFAGCIISTFLGTIPNLILPFFGNTQYTSTGPVFTLILVICMAYAILKHRLMDIVVAITRTTIFAIVYTIALGVPFLLTTFAKDTLTLSLGANWWLAPLILMGFLATIGPFVYMGLLRGAEAILMREQRTYRETLRQAATGIARMRNTKKLLDFIADTVVDSLDISHAALYLLDAQQKKFTLQAARNFAKSAPRSIDGDERIIDWLQNKESIIVHDEIKRYSEDNPDSACNEVMSMIQRLSATVVIASSLEDTLLEIMVLGEKRSGRTYTSEDLNNFSIFAAQAAFAIENSTMYEHIEEKVRQRTEELLQVQKQLVQAEKLATVGTLAGGVAHEINNPLAAILTNAQMLLDSEEIKDESDRESLELIEEATKRCRTIVKKLMVYARKPAETKSLTRLDLLEVINNVVNFLGYQLEQDSITLIKKLPAQPQYVMGRQNELEQAVTNMILNAKDAIKRIKKSGKVTVSVLGSNNTVKLEISDEGIGMEPDVIKKIFDPFYTTKDVGKGLGLGLSICQSIVERHSGKINVKSKVKKGSTFTVELPKAKER